MPSNPIELTIADKSYLDFKSARVTYSMDQLARTFSFDFSDKWLNTLGGEMPFVEGDDVEVKVYGKTVCKGYIEDLPQDWDAQHRSISVGGRGKACDLVDCSAIHKTGSWRNATLLTIAKGLVEPFGLQVKVDPLAVAQAAPPFTKQAIEDEETVFGCLSRLAKMRGLFLVGDENGNVTITKASPIVFPYTLIQGVNIKRGRRVTGYRERFSEYTIKSQRAGDDTFFADNVGRGFYKTQDPQITRYRPLIIVSDGQGSSTELKTRGDWERNYRAGQSRKLAYDHPGFLSVTGQLFPINQLIAVQDDVDDFTGTLLIASVHYQLGFPGGEMTTLELADPATYDVLIPPKPRPKRSGGSLF